MQYKKEITNESNLFLCDPAGARTQDPNIKSVVLYLLSYWIKKKYVMKKKWSSWGSNPGPQH